MDPEEKILSEILNEVKRIKKETMRWVQQSEDRLKRLETRLDQISELNDQRKDHCDEQHIQFGRLVGQIYRRMDRFDACQWNMLCEIAALKPLPSTFFFEDLERLAVSGEVPPLGQTLGKESGGGETEELRGHSESGAGAREQVGEDERPGEPD